jgi:hypothetical protein
VPELVLEPVFERVVAIWTELVLSLVAEGIVELVDVVATWSGI